MSSISFTGLINSTATSRDWMTELPSFAISAHSTRPVLPPPPSSQTSTPLEIPTFSFSLPPLASLINDKQKPLSNANDELVEKNDQSPILSQPFVTADIAEQARFNAVMMSELCEGDISMGFKKKGSIAKVYEERWEEMFDQLRQFKLKHGHCNVRQRYKNPQLGHWVNSMRGRKKAGELSDDRIRKLEELGFTWQYRNKAWLVRYDELKKFKASFGHCNVPTSWEQNPKLGRWVQYMRKKRLSSKLGSDQIQKLEELGMEWRPSTTDGSSLKEDGLSGDEENSNFPDCSSNENSNYAWSDASMSRDDIVDLQDPTKDNATVGLILNNGRFTDQSTMDEDTNSMIEAPLCVPSASVISSPTPKKRKVSDIQDNEEEDDDEDKSGSASWPRPTWYQRYDQLKAFKSRFGHCKVPYRWGENPGLGRWVSLMRKKRKENKLEEHKEKLLNDLSFAWSLVGYRTRLDKRGREDDNTKRGWKFVEELSESKHNTEDSLMPPKKRRRMMEGCTASPLCETAPSDEDSMSSPVEEENEQRPNGLNLILQAAEDIVRND